jgi:hypothetical protein
MIVAALGALYSKASSPNESPGPYSFKNVSVVSSGFIYFLQINDPFSTI